MEPLWHSRTPLPLLLSLPLSSVLPKRKLLINYSSGTFSKREGRRRRADAGTANFLSCFFRNTRTLFIYFFLYSNSSAKVTSESEAAKGPGGGVAGSMEDLYEEESWWQKKKKAIKKGNRRVRRWVDGSRILDQIWIGLISGGFFVSTLHVGLVERLSRARPCSGSSSSSSSSTRACSPRNTTSSPGGSTPSRRAPTSSSSSSSPARCSLRCTV